MPFDVIAIGGSYAGMAASLQLLRARRSVLVIDAGQQRNRFARHSHGFLGQDGADPAGIARTARRQLEAYQTLTWVEGRAVAASGRRDEFTVSTDDGQVHEGRRILLATGVSDQLPEIPGLAERWGRTVFHCPYCHGYELNGGRIGVIATGPMSVHQAELLTEWGDVTFLTNSVLDLDPAGRQALQDKGVEIDESAIDRIDGEAVVLLSGGLRRSFAGLFTAPRCAPSSPLPAEMGCRLDETPMGLQIRTSAAQETSVPGVFACGDVASVPHSVSLAVGHGALAGIQIHRSLVWPGS
ncbi:NAD(P)/FAD-dependent oxidoreductase [Rubellimicrobium arenae]|uniref:NAD(P)/FAD-dependent oxidoreductase n=1 Tax=Rubellimicrobium arenae TaxID=2817372 RepID=UPI001B316345|nr:NAD(P)/FAD-dependent oxidoreductase [Rubellimicrobium arenae]